MFSMLQTFLQCGTLLTIAFLVLLALPQCELRTFLMPIVSWAMTVFCALYVVSPVDVVPEAVFGPVGLIDDVLAAVVGYASYKKATSSPS